MENLVVDTCCDMIETHFFLFALFFLMLRFPGLRISGAIKILFYLVLFLSRLSNWEVGFSFW